MIDHPSLPWNGTTTTTTTTSEAGGDDDGGNDNDDDPPDRHDNEKDGGGRRTCCWGDAGRAPFGRPPGAAAAAPGGAGQRQGTARHGTASQRRRSGLASLEPRVGRYGPWCPPNLSGGAQGVVREEAGDNTSSMIPACLPGGRRLCPTRVRKRRRCARRQRRSSSSSSSSSENGRPGKRRGPACASQAVCGGSRCHAASSGTGGYRRGKRQWRRRGRRRHFVFAGSVDRTAGWGRTDARTLAPGGGGSWARRSSCVAALTPSRSAIRAAGPAHRRLVTCEAPTASVRRVAACTPPRRGSPLGTGREDGVETASHVSGKPLAGRPDAVHLVPPRT
jgi:hypothetical protein